jgi:hypothetical protein
MKVSLELLKLNFYNYLPAVQPPSEIMDVPVIEFAISVVKKNVIPAISSTVENFPNGILLLIIFSLFFF